MNKHTHKVNQPSKIFHALAMSLMMVTPLFTGCASTPSKPKYVQGDNYAYTKQYMTQFIKEQMEEYDMTGVSIALVDGSKANPIIWAQGFGWADKEQKLPATANTLYRAGSTTKLFTATAIMQLAEQGKLNIDKPIQTYLPNITIRNRFASKAPVTIRNMLTHHSGLPGDRLNGMWGDATADFSQLANQTYDLVAPPNTQQAYSNLAMSLLGQVIENVSGMTYEDYIKQKILTPIGMHNSYIGKTLSVKKGHAKGYYNGKTYTALSIRDTAAGGLNASVLELAKFAQMTFAQGKTAQGQRILSAKTLATMQTGQTSQTGQTAKTTGNSLLANNNMGLAWFLTDMPNQNQKDIGQSAGHDGATMMFNTEFTTLPSQKLAVVVMANGLNDEGVGTANIADKMMQLALASKSGIRLTTDTPLPNKQPTPAADLKRFDGTWINNDLGEITIKKKGNKLKLVMDDNEIDLVHRGGHTYYPEYKLLGISMDLGGLGKMNATYRTYNNLELLQLNSPSLPYKMHAEKVKPQPLSSVSPIWKKRLGAYKTVKASGGFTFKDNDTVFTHEDGIFKIKTKIKGIFSDDYVDDEILIKLIDDNRGVVYGVGRNTGDVVNFKTLADGGVLLTYSGYEFRK